MEVVDSRIPQTLGRRFLKNSSVVRSPQQSIFRDVPHNGIRFPLFLHVYFLMGYRLCVYFPSSFIFKRTSCMQIWGPTQALCLASPWLAAPATAWLPANSWISGSHARLLAPYRFVLHPLHSGQKPYCCIHPCPFRVLLTLRLPHLYTCPLSLAHGAHPPQDRTREDRPYPTADSFVLPLEVTLCGMRREGSILAP